MGSKVEKPILLLKSIIKDCYGKICDSCQDNLEDALNLLKEIKKEEDKEAKHEYWMSIRNFIGDLNAHPESGENGQWYINTNNSLSYSWIDGGWYQAWDGRECTNYKYNPWAK